MSQVHPESALPSRPTESALDVQVGGDHYKKLNIQPMEYSMANGLDACQHTAIKYITRFRDKGGVADLEKAKHCIDMLIEFEARDAEQRKKAAPSLVHSDAKTTTRCAESAYKAVCAQQGHRWTQNPATGEAFCAVCTIDMPPPTK